MLTAYYAIQTRALVVEGPLDRAVRCLPLLFWQSPQATCGVSRGDSNVIRRQLNVVLWNIGSGAARVTRKHAANGEGVSYEIAHFDAPSIVPEEAQLTLRLFCDQSMVEVIAANDSHFLRAEEIQVSLHYEDVVEHRHYETHIVVRCPFDEAKDGR